MRCSMTGSPSDSRSGHRSGQIGFGGNLERSHGARGTLIRHAAREKLQSDAKSPLAIPVVQAALGTGLVAGVGSATGPPAGEPAASRSALKLAAITASADMKDHPAKSAPALTIAVVQRARPEANARETLTTERRGGRLKSNVGVRKYVGTGAWVSITWVPTFLSFATGSLTETGGCGEGATRAPKGQKYAETGGRLQF